MCKFFSFVTKGHKKYYFDWDMRKTLMKDNPNDYQPDSHSSICAFFKLDDDKVNKYEYNPLTKEFTVDQVNIKDNQGLAKKWVDKLDFKTIIEPLNLRPIIHPFKDIDKVDEVTEKHIELLMQWDSVGALVWDSVWASVRASVGASVGASVWDSVWASVRDSVGAIISSYFDLDNWVGIEHEEGVNPFMPCVELWEQGLVPSYDGKVWRLHSGENADIVNHLNH